MRSTAGTVARIGPTVGIKLRMKPRKPHRIAKSTPKADKTSHMLTHTERQEGLQEHVVLNTGVDRRENTRQRSASPVASLAAWSSRSSTRRRPMISATMSSITRTMFAANESARAPPSRHCPSGP